jgi:hypothetical protein
MKLTENLSEFNRRMADELQSTFAPSIRPYQTEDGALVFRGPIAGRDPQHVGTHASISLEKDVLAALNDAAPSQRGEMTKNLLANLGTQVRAQYDPNNIGQVALEVKGTVAILKG